MDAVMVLARALWAGLTVDAKGDQLIVRGPECLAPLADEVLARKADILAFVRHEHRRKMYASLTADIGTPEHVEALWLAAHRHSEAILGELLALDRRCAELARCGAPEAEFRAAVEELVAKVREVRALYDKATKDRDGSQD